MISLKSYPDRIMDGETLKVELVISGKVNEKMYYGKYLNLNIIKNDKMYKSNRYYSEAKKILFLRYKIEKSQLNSWGSHKIQGLALVSSSEKDKKIMM